MHSWEYFDEDGNIYPKDELHFEAVNQLREDGERVDGPAIQDRMADIADYLNLTVDITD